MTQPQIDHIIVLLPHADVIKPPQWLTDRFTISPGGCHADGLTENKLILLQDGSYIELIAFIDDEPERRAGHWWDLPFGLVDYALTDTAGHFDPAINTRLQAASSMISYNQPQRGGRKRPDGVEMEWEVTFPKGVPRGVVPFWCHDLTPRHRRVPVTEAATTHPCGALGINAVNVLLPGRRGDEARAALAAIMGATIEDSFSISAPSPLSRQPVLQVRTGEQHKIELSLQLSETGQEESIEQKLGSGSVKIDLKRDR